MLDAFKDLQREFRYLHEDAVTTAMVWYQLDLPSSREIPVPQWYRHPLAFNYYTPEEVMELNALAPFRVDTTSINR